MTGPDLEQQFFDCASLFLARLTAWIRIRLSPNATAVGAYIYVGLNRCIHVYKYIWAFILTHVILKGD